MEKASGGKKLRDEERISVGVVVCWTWAFAGDVVM